MMKTVATVLLALALCSYTAQGASVGDAQAAVNIGGSQMMKENIFNLNQAGLASGQPCAAPLVQQGIANLIKIIVAEQGKLRAEIPSSLAELPSLSLEQLVQRVRGRLEPIVNSAVQDALNQINNCA